MGGYSEEQFVPGQPFTTGEPGGMAQSCSFGESTGESTDCKRQTTENLSRAHKKSKSKGMELTSPSSEANRLQDARCPTEMRQRMGLAMSRHS